MENDDTGAIRKLSGLSIRGRESQGRHYYCAIARGPLHHSTAVVTLYEYTQSLLFVITCPVERADMPSSIWPPATVCAGEGQAEQCEQQREHCAPWSTGRRG